MNNFRYIVIGKSTYTYFHIAVFLLTFFSYALFHASRKTFSNVKTTISETWTDSSLTKNDSNSLKPDGVWNTHSFFGNKDEAKIFLGVLDALFLASYSIGLFISGIIGDRYNLRIVLTFGMCGSAITVFMFGALSEWINLYSKYWYALFWILNGLAQSTGWPTVVAIMGNWFDKSGRGFIFGIWSACASVGNIIGALMVSSVLDYGYQFAFLFTSVSLFSGGIINYCGLVPHPKDIGLNMENSDNKKSASINQPLLEKTKNTPIRFIDALLLPGVIMYSLCYACVKMINYSFFFWLPFYLSNKFNWAETVSDRISIWYDVGGIFGGIIGGLVSDILNKRSIVVTVMLLLAVPSLYVYSESPDNQNINALLMSITGFFIGGVANMISAAITADLGKQGPVQGNKEALSTVTGIVDGTGSIGAALGQILVPLIQQKWNWFYVFYLFIILCFLTIFCILPLCVKEVIAIYHEIKNKSYRAVQENDPDAINTANDE